MEIAGDSQENQLVSRRQHGAVLFADIGVRTHASLLQPGLSPVRAGRSGPFFFRQFIGRAVAALATDPDAIRHTVHSLVAAAIARDYGFTDIDGKTPRPLTLGDV
jgi:hypothetical protein